MGTWTLTPHNVSAQDLARVERKEGQETVHFVIQLELWIAQLVTGVSNQTSIRIFAHVADSLVPERVEREGFKHLLGHDEVLPAYGDLFLI